MAHTGDIRNHSLLLNNNRAANNFVRITVDSNRRLQLYDGQYRTIADNERAKTFDAIVDAAGTGDYTTVSAALAAGKETIYLRVGTYIETTPWNIMGSVYIIGENVADTIVLFAGLNVPCVFVDGNNGVTETTGTISVTSGTTTVTGVGTTFTNLSVGNFILIGTTVYEIASITNDTSLTITRTYYGITVTDLPYLGGVFMQDVLINNLTIMNSTVSPCTSIGVRFRGIIRGVIRNTHIFGFVGNISYETCVGGLFLESSSVHSKSYGLTMIDCFNSLVDNSNTSNNLGDGIVVTGVTLGSDTVILTHMISSSNTGSGVSITNGSAFVNFSDAIITYNAASGIRTTNGTSNVLISSCNVSNNDDGISFLGMNNSIVGTIITNNTGTGIIPGDNCSITSCGVNENGDNGVELMNDVECNITGCYFNSNTGSGIEITGNSANNVITGNSFINNTVYGVNFDSNSGGESTITGNVFVDNTTAGIRVQNDNNIVTGNRVTGSATGILIEASANDTIVTSNNTVNCTVGITDNGTGTSLGNNK